MSALNNSDHDAPRHAPAGKTGRHSAHKESGERPKKTSPAPEEERPRKVSGDRGPAEERRRKEPRSPERPQGAGRKPAQNAGRKPARTGAPRKRKSKKKARTKKILLIVLSALAALILLGVFFYFRWVSAPKISDRGLKQQATSTPEATTFSPAPEESAGAAEVNAAPTPTASPTATPGPTPEPIQAKRREDTYTLLLVGRDRVGMNTDTIMVARMDCKEGTLDVVSIPRDTLVNVPWGVKKVNSIYGTLNTEGLVENIENLVGFGIDSYAIINTFAFQELVDCIGGVYFDVPINMYYDAPDQDLYIHLNAGYQLLNGAQAEQVVRFRQNNDGSGYGTGDLGRIETQHAFLKALAKQMLSIGNISNLSKIAKIVTENTDTNLTSGNIAFYAQEFLKLDSEKINFYTIPYDTVYIQGGSYISIQLQPWVDMINEKLNPFRTDVTEANLDVLTFDGTSFYSTTGNTPSFASFYNYFG